MTKNELCQEFINRLSNQNYQEIYKFFTKDTTYYVINENKEISYEETLTLLKEQITSSLEIKRVLESNVCIKYETVLLSKQYNFFMEVKNRRIIRFEIEII